MRMTRPIKMNSSGRATTDVAQIKRRLFKGIRELEKIAYIKAVPFEQRFTKNGVGKWEVHFERELRGEDQEQGAPEIELEEMTPLEGRLVGHGVSRFQARKLIGEYDPGRIQMQLEALEFLLERGGEAAPANRGGWLVKAIAENYSPPRGFKSSIQLAEENRQKAETAKRKLEAARRKKAEEEAARGRASADWEKNQSRIREHLKSLTPQKRTELEIDALSGSPFGRGQISARLRQTIIENYILDILDGRSAP